MKITKNQLRRIIKESRILKEGSETTALLGQLHEILSSLRNSMSAMELADELRGIADDIEVNAKYETLPADDDPAELARHKAYRDSVRLPESAKGPDSEGTRLEDMSDSWRQILGSVLKGL